MKSLTPQITFIFASILLTTSTYAQIDIGGDVVQEAELKNSPTTSIAAGANAKVATKVNSVEGRVTIKGNLKQTLHAKNSPTTSLALGSGAEAETKVNSLSGN